MSSEDFPSVSEVMRILLRSLLTCVGGRRLHIVKSIKNSGK